MCNHGGRSNGQGRKSDKLRMACMLLRGGVILMGSEGGRCGEEGGPGETGRRRMRRYEQQGVGVRVRGSREEWVMSSREVKK